MKLQRGIAIPAMGSSAVIPVMSDMSDWKSLGGGSCAASVEAKGEAKRTTGKKEVCIDWISPMRLVVRAPDRRGRERALGRGSDAQDDGAERDEERRPRRPHDAHG